MPASSPITTASTPMSCCCKSTLAILAFVLIAATVLFSVFLVIFGVSVSDCDLTCDEDTDGAELLNEGIYDCDGKTSCGPLRAFFYICLGITLGLLLLWVVIISLCCWRRRRRRTAAGEAPGEAAGEAALGDLKAAAGSDLKSSSSATHRGSAHDGFPAFTAPEAVVAVPVADMGVHH